MRKKLGLIKPAFTIHDIQLHVVDPDLSGADDRSRSTLGGDLSREWDYMTRNVGIYTNIRASTFLYAHNNYHDDINTKRETHRRDSEKILIQKKTARLYIGVYHCLGVYTL